MWAIVRLVLSGAAGTMIALAIPRAGLLAATQELIGFLALVMAGLLPAMMLTATILRGDGFSARRVEEYGRALSAQLRFWAVLFLLAGLATLGVVMAKMFNEPGSAFALTWWRFHWSSTQAVSFSIGLLGACLGVVLQRLYPAYVGLRSLLELNVSMATAQALANGRSLAQALEADARSSQAPEEYAGTGGGLRRTSGPGA